MKLLAFDTATEMCSVALYLDGRLLVREQELARGHGAELLPLIDAVLAQAGVWLTALDAIAFGRGPGGFTGVRLAASVAQGLAFGAGLPVLPVSNLLAVAQLAFDADVDAVEVLVCNDARMAEVYTATYRRGSAGAPPALLREEAVLAPQDVELFAGPLRRVGAGRGFRAYPALRERLQTSLAAIYDDLLPTARAMLSQARADWHAGLAQPAIAAQPVYLRNNVARPSVT